MAANTFFGGTADDTITFDRPVDYLNVSVASGVTFSLSLDGFDYITLPVGFHSFEIGAISTLYISSSGAWQIIGIQA